MNFRNWPYYRYVLLFTLLALAFAELAPLVVSGVAPIHALLHGRLIADVFFCISLTSAVFVYLILVERRPRDIWTLAILGVPLEIYLYNVRVEHMDWGFALSSIGSGWGTLALIALTLRALERRDPQTQARAEEALTIGLALPCFSLISCLGGQLLYKSDTRVYDCILYTIEGGLGFFPAAFFCKLGRLTPFLHGFSWFIYDWLPAWMVGALIVTCLHPQKSVSRPIVAYVGVGLIGLMLYQILPAVGTEAMCGTVFPYCSLPPLPDPFRVLTAPIVFPRNAMPSLHMGWILTALWALDGQDKRYIRWGLFFLLGTFVTTMSVGGHYSIDTIVAVPFAVAVHMLSVKHYRGNGALLVGVGLGCFLVAVGWIASMRFAPAYLFAHPYLTWTGMLLSAAVALWLKNRVFRHTFALQTAALQPTTPVDAESNMHPAPGEEAFTN